MQIETATHIDLVKGKPSTKFVVRRYIYVGQLRNFVLTALGVNLGAALVAAVVCVN